MLTTINFRLAGIIGFAICCFSLLLTENSSAQIQIKRMRPLPRPIVLPVVPVNPVAPQGGIKADRAFLAKCYQVGAHCQFNKHGKPISVSLEKPVNSYMFRALYLNRIPTLQSLNLSGCTNLKSRYFEELLVSNSKLRGTLKELKIEGCTIIEDHLLRRINVLKKLETLDLSNTNLSKPKNPDQKPKANETALKQISELKNLKTLRLSKCGYLRDADLKYLQQLPNLQRLDLSGCHTLTDKGLQHLSSLKNLIELNLSNIPQLSDAALEAIAKIPTLKILNLKSNTKYSAQGLKAFAHGAAKIERLILSRNRGLKDDDLKAIASISSLKQIDFTAAKVTSTGLAHLKALKNLQSLKLSNVDLVGKKAACLGQLTALEELSLYITTIDDAGLKYLKNCKKLKQLDLSFCDKVSDTSLKIIGTFSQLESLNLSKTGVTGKTLADLKPARKLVDLNLSSLEKLTDTSLASLKELPKLQKLDLSITKIGNRALAHLKTLTELRELNLTSTEVGSISRLRPLGKLEKLNLTHCKIIRTTPLVKMNNLRELTLYKTHLGDSAVEGLLPLSSNLQRLDLTQTYLSAAGFSALQSQMPATKVIGIAKDHHSGMPRPRSGNVQIVVKGECNNAQKRTLLQKFAEASGQETEMLTSYSFSDHEEGILFNLAPVDDFEEFTDIIRDEKELVKKLTISQKERDLIIIELK